MIKRILKGLILTKPALSNLRNFSNLDPKKNNELKTVEKIIIDGKEYEIKEEPTRFGKPYEDYAKEFEQKKG